MAVLWTLTYSRRVWLGFLLYVCCVGIKCKVLSQDYDPFLDKTLSVSF